MTPERMRKTRKASMNLSRDGVESMYAVQSDCRANEDGAGLGSEGACFAVFDDDFGPAIRIWVQYVYSIRYACNLLYIAVSWVLPTTRPPSTPSPMYANTHSDVLVSWYAQFRTRHRKSGHIEDTSRAVSSELVVYHRGNSTCLRTTSKKPPRPVPLPYKIEDGMGDFLSPSALKIIAEDYQQGLLDRLNEQIKRCAYFSLGLGDLLMAILRAGQARGLKIKASRRLSFQPQRTRAKRSPSTTRAWRSTTHFSCIISYYHVLRVSKVLGVSKYKFLRYF